MSFLENFLEKIRASDEAAKTRWLIVFSAAAMVVVVYVWLAYFSSLIAGFAEQAVLQPVAQAPAESGSGGRGFLDRAGGGIASIFHAAYGGLNWLGSALAAPREYIIKPPK